MLNPSTPVSLGIRVQSIGHRDGRPDEQLAAEPAQSPHVIPQRQALTDPGIGDGGQDGPAGVGVELPDRAIHTIRRPVHPGQRGQQHQPAFQVVEVGEFACLGLGRGIGTVRDDLHRGDELQGLRVATVPGRPAPDVLDVAAQHLRPRIADEHQFRVAGGELPSGR